MEGEYQGGMAADRTASDADRSLAIASLREAAQGGVFDIDELQVRLDAALRARTVGELATITWEARLPDVIRSAPPTREADESLSGLAKLRRNTGFRIHSTVYAVSNAFLLGTWAITGGVGGHEFFWPFFPVAGWGIGLAAHAAAVSHAQPKSYVHEDGTWHHDPEKGWSFEPREGAGRAELAPGDPGGRSGRGGGEVGRGVRYVTVVFVDVANSTALNEAIGDEAWSRLRARHLAKLRECVASHDGTEVSTAGDGLFARFDLPGQAVACAVEIQRRLDADLEETGFAPRVRIGVHAGEAVEDESDLIGNMVNIASRVAAVAAPGEICVTEPVADKVSDRFRLEDRGLKTLKGVARPRHLLSVQW